MSCQSLLKMTQTIRRYCLWAITLIVMFNLAIFVLFFASLPESVEAVTKPSTETNIEIPIIKMETGLIRSLPVNLEIPEIGLNTTFVSPLGLNPDRTVSVPDNYTEVGWYTGGVTPGEVGPAVILGHVDSYQGPAVFYKLGKLEAGDEIKITREDGSVVVFLVDFLERYSQDNFPTTLVYGSVDYPGLRLVTCSGIFDRAEQRYSHNLVVYAKLK